MGTLVTYRDLPGGPMKIKFANEISRHCLCRQCHMLSLCMYSDSASHMFCYDCLNDQSYKHKKCEIYCPDERKDVSLALMFQARDLVTILCDEYVECPNQPKCTVKLPLGQLEKHYIECKEMSSIKCTKCGHKVLSTSWMEQKTDCQPTCGSKLPRKSQGPASIDPEITTCKHCGRKVKESHVSRHLEVCYKVRAPCPYCDENVARKDMKAHIEECMHKFEEASKVLPTRGAAAIGAPLHEYPQHESQEWGLPALPILHTALARHQNEHALPTREHVAARASMQPDFNFQRQMFAQPASPIPHIPPGTRRPGILGDCKGVRQGGGNIQMAAHDNLENKPSQSEATTTGHYLGTRQEGGCSETATGYIAGTQYSRSEETSVHSSEVGQEAGCSQMAASESLRTQPSRSEETPLRERLCSDNPNADREADTSPTAAMDCTPRRRSDWARIETQLPVSVNTNKPHLTPEPKPSDLSKVGDDALLSCPICNRHVKSKNMDKHISVCLQRTNRPSSPEARQTPEIAPVLPERRFAAIRAPVQEYPQHQSQERVLPAFYRPNALAGQPNEHALTPQDFGSAPVRPDPNLERQKFEQRGSSVEQFTPRGQLHDQYALPTRDYVAVRASIQPGNFQHQQCAEPPSPISHIAPGERWPGIEGHSNGVRQGDGNLQMAADENLENKPSRSEETTAEVAAVESDVGYPLSSFECLSASDVPTNYDASERGHYSGVRQEGGYSQVAESDIVQKQPSRSQEAPGDHHRSSSRKSNPSSQSVQLPIGKWPQQLQQGDWGESKTTYCSGQAPSTEAPGSWSNSWNYAGLTEAPGSWSNFWNYVGLGHCIEDGQESGCSQMTASESVQTQPSLSEETPVLHDVRKEMHLSPESAEPNEKNASFMEGRTEAFSTTEETRKSWFCFSPFTK